MIHCSPFWPQVNAIVACNARLPDLVIAYFHSPLEYLTHINNTDMLAVGLTKSHAVIPYAATFVLYISVPSAISTFHHPWVASMYRVSVGLHQCLHECMYIYCLTVYMQICAIHQL